MAENLLDEFFATPPGIQASSSTGGGANPPPMKRINPENKWKGLTPVRKSQQIIRDGLLIPEQTAGEQSLMLKIQKDLKKPSRVGVGYKKSLSQYQEWSEVKTILTQVQNTGAYQRWNANKAKFDTQLRLLPGGDPVKDAKKSMKAKQQDIDLFEIPECDLTRITVYIGELPCN
ncbi:unnamed protein product [Amoebophrya sp. A25]|nr:unnamed protein product [Amoebophrya sp. A25]|eukprot:GSA25T00008144001.1